MFKKRRNRKFTRINTHCLLKYKGSGNEPTLSFVRNIGAGGALFHCKEKIPVGSIVELTINFIGYPKPIETKAKVLRVKALKKISGFFVAVEFIKIENKARDFINAKILDMYKTQGKDWGEGK